MFWFLVNGKLSNGVCFLKHLLYMYTIHTLCAETCFGGDDMDILGLMRRCQQVLVLMP